MYFSVSARKIRSLTSRCLCFFLSLTHHSSASEASMASANKQRASLSTADRNMIEPTTASPQSEAAILLHKIRHYIENHRQHIFYLLLFYSVCVAIFAERFYCKRVYDVIDIPVNPYLYEFCQCICISERIFLFILCTVLLLSDVHVRHSPCKH